jgi:hypothetical protein
VHDGAVTSLPPHAMAANSRIPTAMRISFMARQYSEPDHVFCNSLLWPTIWPLAGQRSLKLGTDVALLGSRRSVRELQVQNRMLIAVTISGPET